MAISLYTAPRSREFTTSGQVLSGAKLYFFQAGTSTPAVAYQDSARTVAHSHPVVADTSGLFPAIWLDPGVSHDVRLTSSTGATQYFTANYNDSLTIDDVGQILYPRTTAEVTASVLPSFYYYPPGDVRRYGASTALADSSAAIQAAYNVARYSGFVHFGADGVLGAAYKASGILVYSNTTTTADGGVILRKNATGSTSHVFDAAATLSAPIPLTANSAEGAKTVTAGSTTGVVAGQVVLVRDATYAYGSTGRNQEVAEVESVTGTTVTFKSALSRTYLTASTAEIVTFSTDKRNIVFDGLTVDLPTGIDGGGYAFDYAYNCHVRNGKVIGPDSQPAVLLHRSTGCTVSGGQIVDGKNASVSGSGIGVSLSNATRCVASRMSSCGVRENNISVGSRFCELVDCDDTSAYDAAFKITGEGNHDCGILRNRSTTAVRNGIAVLGTGGQAPSNRASVRENEVFDSGRGGILLSGSVSYEPRNAVIAGNRVVGFGRDGTNSYGIDAAFAVKPVIENNTVVGKSAAAFASVYADTCSDARIIANTCLNNTTGYGIVHKACTGVLVSGNSIRDIDPAKAGVVAGAPLSTAAIVVENDIDNDVQFTAGAGVTYRGNRYATKSDTRLFVATGLNDGSVVNHDLIAAPTKVLATSQVASEFVSVNTITATQMTVRIKKDTGAAGTAGQAVTFMVEI